MFCGLGDVPSHLIEIALDRVLANLPHQCAEADAYRTG